MKQFNLKDFYLFIKESKKRPMVSNETEVLMRFMMNKHFDRFYEIGDEKKEGIFREYFGEGSMVLPMSILNKRPKDHGVSLRISYGVVALISIASKMHIGSIVMYMAYLIAWSLENERSDIDLSLVAREVFPDGFPSEEILEEAWGKQKDGGANRLDMNDFYNWN